MRIPRIVAAVAAVLTIGVVVFLLAAHPGAGPRSPVTTSRSSGYLFDDEFNGPPGSKPSSKLWNAKRYRADSGTVWNGWKNISENGHGDLVITARKVNGSWYSGFLSGNVAYTGPRYVEVRAKVAAGSGVWNAPAWEWDVPSGAAGVEDDVVEQLGRQPQDFRTTLHAGPTVQKGFLNATGVTLSKGFHTYAAAVTSGRLNYYFDGKRVRSIQRHDLGGRWGFVTTPMVANISLAIGGLGGTRATARPVSLLVDWIRVSARKS